MVNNSTNIKKAPLTWNKWTQKDLDKKNGSRLPWSPNQNNWIFIFAFMVWKAAI